MLVLATLCAITGVQHDPATNVYADDALVIRAEVGNQPEHVDVFWRRSGVDPAFAVIQMEKVDSDCAYAIDLPIVAGTYGIDYYIVAGDESVGSVAAPLTHVLQVAESQPPCVDPCMCGGPCGVTLPLEPLPPPPPPRYHLGLGAGARSRDAMITGEVGLRATRRLEVSLLFSFVPQDSDQSGGMLRVRRFLLGHNGLEVNASIGAMKTIVAGVGAGYSRRLTRKMTAIGEIGVLAGLEGERAGEATLGIQLGF